MIKQGKKRIVIDIDSKLWHEVGIRVAEEASTKYAFVEAALREKLKRGGWANGNQNQHNGKT